MKKWFGSEREEKLWKIFSPFLSVLPVVTIVTVLSDRVLFTVIVTAAYYIISLIFDFPGVINLILWIVGFILLLFFEPWQVILIYVLLFLYLLARAVLISGREL